MDYALLTVAYLVAGVLFILGLGGLSAQETARRGNLYGILGMIIAVIVVLFPDRPKTEQFETTTTQATAEEKRLGLFLVLALIAWMTSFLSWGSLPGTRARILREFSAKGW